MKLSFLVLTGFLIAGANPAFAGTQSDQENGSLAHIVVQKRLERMTNKLDLTPDQQTEVKKILEEQVDKFKALRKEFMSNMTAVLTDSQREKVEHIRKNRRDLIRRAMNSFISQ